MMGDMALLHWTVCECIVLVRMVFLAGNGPVMRVRPRGNGKVSLNLVIIEVYLHNVKSHDDFG